MKVIYRPSGKAKEYFGLAANLYRGCDHGCVYCYVPGVMHMKREEFSTVVPLHHKLADLEHDLKHNPELAKEGPLLLSFTTDPYNHMEPTEKITHKTIEICNRYDMPVAILTKGGRRSFDDLHLLAQNPKSRYGVTLTHYDQDELATWEPGAASYYDRALGLKRAYEMGINTFVSMEPVIDTNAALEIIRALAVYVDEFKVGMLNYNKAHANTIDWGKFHDDAVALMESAGVKYYIKDDLKKAANGAGKRVHMGMERL